MPAWLMAKALWISDKYDLIASSGCKFLQSAGSLDETTILPLRRSGLGYTLQSAGGRLADREVSVRRRLPGRLATLRPEPYFV
jgi:hypothetical protein